jgi:hypothetical protein
MKDYKQQAEEIFLRKAKAHCIEKYGEFSEDDFNEWTNEEQDQLNVIIAAITEALSLSEHKGYSSEEVYEIIAASWISKDIGVEEAKAEFPKHFQSQLEVAKKWIVLTGGKAISDLQKEIEQLKQEKAELKAVIFQMTSDELK